MKIKYKYLVTSLTDLSYLIRELKLEEKAFTLTELNEKMDKRLLSIVVELNEKNITSYLDYESNDYESIHKNFFEVLTLYITDKNAFNDFKYKIQINNSYEKEQIISFANTFGFSQNAGEDNNKYPLFCNIAILKAYQGIRKIFNFSHDSYLFERGDDFKKVSFDRFEKIVFIMENLGKLK